MLELFIEQKSRQLVFYLSRFLRDQLPHYELHLFVWDTLEEWALLHVDNKTPSTYQEQVFWHLLHQLEFWSEHDLKTDKKVKKHLQQAMACLLGRQVRSHEDFIGIRP